MGNLKVESKVQVTTGMKVNDVIKNGSKGQRIAANMFDVDGNGVFDKKETELFNNCTFKTEKGKITIYDNEQRKKGHGGVIEIHYDSKTREDMALSGYKYGYQRCKAGSCWESGMGKSFRTLNSGVEKIDSFDKITVHKPTTIEMNGEYAGGFENVQLDGVKAKRIVDYFRNDNYMINSDSKIGERTDIWG